MVKKKLKRFKELNTFNNVYQPTYSEVLDRHYYLKGKWCAKHFNNNNPLVVELGCGKGEYTTGLAKSFPDTNFMGLDIKGARMWQGARYASENGLLNVAFLRTRIEFVESFFEKNEVSEIWLTFPDPHEKDRMSRKRLTSPRFINHYRTFLKEDGCVHLKTDNTVLYEYTLGLILKNKFEILVCTDDLYATSDNTKILGIKTFYEGQFLEAGEKIKYIKFRINSDGPVKEPDNE